jgi:hypothetical protein
MGGSVGRWEKVSKTKKKETGGGRGENKVPKTKKKTEIRAEKGQTKKVNLGWHRDRKENPISAPSIHVGALVGCWFTLQCDPVPTSTPFYWKPILTHLWMKNI